ncbi:hypothetical protein [Rhodococcus sp. UNC363MFTsu5.1]|uniref:hypothetical protein n=1 Tax=Rhodococcus sp. UNC363MFTsu5.1 TaxID=1449069 RepID=UPI000485CAB8|nr:hypothetical protein [Rhodococcus sp. UNC363MFTsu5.1]
MTHIRRIRSLAALLPLTAVLLGGCSAASSEPASADGAACVDATLPNATAEELVDVLRPRGDGTADSVEQNLADQFAAARPAQIERVEQSAVFKNVPEDGDAGFAGAVCADSRWDDITAGAVTLSPRAERAAIVSAGHGYCDAYEQMLPAAVSTGSWKDWAGFTVSMVGARQSALDAAKAAGRDSTTEQQALEEETRALEAARQHICPQFG